MTAFRKVLLGTALATTALAICAATASAAVVCRGSLCWHTHERYDYPPSARVVVHDDGWHWGRRDHFRWREHEGRGYWEGRRWTDF
jgi:hypothetical protein